MIPSPLSPELSQGRTQLQLALGVLFVLGSAPTVANWVRGDLTDWTGKAVGIVLSALLLWQVYAGRRWALYITLALSVLGGLALTLLSPLAGLSPRLPLLLAAGLAFAASGLALYAHPPIKGFLAYQSRRRGNGNA